MPNIPLLRTTITSMPAKLDDSENLRFLYACFKTTEPNKVDYAKVGQEFGIKEAAARMRLLRLKESLGDKQAGKSLKHRREQKRAVRKGKKGNGAKEGLEVRWMGGEDEDEDEDMVLVGEGKKESNGEVKKKEEVGRDVDMKMLPEAPATPALSVGPDVQSCSSVELANTAMQTPPPEAEHCSFANATPQMPTFSMAPAYACSNPHVAMPQSPSIHSTPWSYQPGQQRYQ